METRIANIGQLVTPLPSPGAEMGSRLQIVEQVDITIRSGRIEAIRPASGRVTGSEFDAAGRVVIPGLIDPRCHLRNASSPLSPSVVGDTSGGSGLLSHALRSGTTTLGILCRDGENTFEDLSYLAHASRGRSQGQGPRISACLFCAPTVSGTTSKDGLMSRIIGDVIPTVRRRRLAQFCDVKLGEDAFSVPEARTILRAARGAGLRLKLSTERPIGSDALRLAAELEVTSLEFCGAIPARGMGILRRVGIVPVLLPSGFFFSPEAPPDIHPALEGGLPLALATDHGAGPLGIGSVWTLLAIAVAELGMSFGDALAACTLHAAWALGIGGDVGSIEVGKRADLLVLDVEHVDALSEELGRNPVASTVVDGHIAQTP